MLRFLTDELEDAEDQGDRGKCFLKHHFCVSVKKHLPLVWIVGHVLSGWDGINPLEAPTNLCEYRALWHFCSVLII